MTYNPIQHKLDTQTAAWVVFLYPLQNGIQRNTTSHIDRVYCSGHTFTSYVYPSCVIDRQDPPPPSPQRIVSLTLRGGGGVQGQQLSLARTLQADGGLTTLLPRLHHACCVRLCTGRRTHSAGGVG